MTTSTAQERPRTALSRLGTPWLCLAALLGGFVAAAALTGLLPADLRIPVGEWGALAVFLAGAIPLAVVDARTTRLPNRGTYPLAMAACGYWVGIALTTGTWSKLIQAIACAVVIFLIAFVIGMIGTLALGDIKLMLSIGLLTGWISWLLPVYALVAAYILAVPHALALIARKRKTGTSTVLPFGPYLVTATTAVVIAAIAATH